MEALQKSEERLALALESAHIGTWDLNLDSNHLSWDSNMFALYGVDEKQFGSAYETWQQSLHPDDLESASAGVATAIRTGQNFKGEFRIIRPDGEVRYLQANAVLVSDKSGHVSRMVGINTDISAERLREESLKNLAHELKASNDELEQFAYVISHDLRQPLRMVSSYVQLLERSLADLLKEDTRQMMGFAVDGVNRMEQMLASLLEYSRVGRMGEPMAPLKSREALDEALSFLQPVVKESGSLIEIRGDWPEVVVSRNEFTRLFQNLIDNAIKYRDPERRPEITITVQAEGSGWEFTISDNGIGVDPQQIARLFKVFQRLHPSNRYEGTGIGLAVSRKIVERHGGRIWLESEGEGMGCRLIIWLPGEAL
ncbi:MAG: PAS domain-containing protein [Gammaproteobacteria bacterium]|nr:PAS domain-containing protein [Gammaproteobacteria bacterium]